MADDASLFDPGVLPEGTVRLTPDSGDVGPGFDPGVMQPPAPARPGGFLNRAWQTVLDIPPAIYRDLTGQGGPPPVPQTPIDPAEGYGPFFAAIPHGARQVIDSAAEKLALGAEKLIGKDTLAKLPGYRSAEDIRADMEQRDADYKANPQNMADSGQAGAGRFVGSALTLGGPVAGAGRLAGAGLRAIPGVAALPGAGRALEYASGAAEAAPGASLPARLGTRAASLSAQGAEAGAGVGAIEADPRKPVLPQIATGAGEGAIAGPLVGSAIAGATYPVRAAIGALPGMVNRGIVDLARRFETQFGIRLDPSQLTQNSTYKLMTDQAGKLPFSGAADRIAQSRLEWQQAVAREFGETAAPDGVTHAVANSAARRIGAGLDTITGRTTIQRDGTMLNDFVRIAQDIPRFGLTDAQLTPVRAQFRNVLDAFAQGRGRMTGEAYQNLTQTGGPLDSVISSTDPTVAAFGMRIKRALDGAFERSAAPGDRDQLVELLRQYRVLKTVQPLVEQKGLTGDIEPNGLLQRVRAQSEAFDPSTRGLAYTGGGRLGDLAYGGQIFFGRQPDSGTAARQYIIGGLLGGGAGAALANPSLVLAPAAALAANRGAQMLLRSPAVGSNMIANTLRPPGPWVQRTTPYALPGLLDTGGGQ